MEGKTAAAQAVHKQTVESDGSDEQSDQGSFFGSEAEALHDGEDVGEVLSPFGPETFASAELCWTHADSAHGFSLKTLRNRVGKEWSDYHRIRLVNHLRKLGPEAARREVPSLMALTAESEIWELEDLLMPVLADDLLLFDAVEESDDSDVEEPHDRSEARRKGKGHGSTGFSNVALQSEDAHT
ncbi:rmt3 [Symbiodinium pilosum]|uniref:Rmt3 protein n=1 Tax=Symbiodinium pilosum TaxID=2952 RepID=A0A812SWK6_SYMPI|nr:rmt3 [Symbiodinium pilosum]